MTALILAWVRCRIGLGPTATVVVVFAIVFLVLCGLAPSGAGAGTFSLLTEVTRLLVAMALLAVVVVVQVHGIVARPGDVASAGADPRARRAVKPLRAVLVTAVQRLCRAVVRECWIPPYRTAAPATTGPEPPPGKPGQAKPAYRMMEAAGRHVYRVLFRERRARVWTLILVLTLVLTLVRFEFTRQEVVGNRPTLQAERKLTERTPGGGVEGLLVTFRKEPASLSSSELAALEAHCESELSERPFGWDATCDLIALYRFKLPVVTLPSFFTCILIAFAGAAGLDVLRRTEPMQRWRLARRRRRRHRRIVG